MADTVLPVWEVAEALRARGVSVYDPRLLPAWKDRVRIYRRQHVPALVVLCADLGLLIGDNFPELSIREEPAFVWWVPHVIK
jgi:hypothetical protein